MVVSAEHFSCHALQDAGTKNHSSAHPPCQKYRVTLRCGKIIERSPPVGIMYDMSDNADLWHGVRGPPGLGAQKGDQREV